MKKIIGAALLITFSSLAFSWQANAATRHVPSQYPTIQAAINKSSNGDEVVIANGVYRENIEVVNKYITIRGNADRQSAVLAGNPGKTPIMIQNVPAVAGAKVVIEGLKITGGNAPDGQGGGITIANNADPIIRNNTIEHNSSKHGGGILVFNNSNPLITENVIHSNYAQHFGGGIFAVKNSSPTISENTITHNSVNGASIQNGGSSGAGIYLENIVTDPSARSKPIVANNTIANNQAEFAGGAIMLRVGVDAIIDSNTITANSAAYGGGIHAETTGSNVVIASNTITGNTAPYRAQFGGSGFGGGISVYDNSKVVMSDNTIQSNQSTSGGAGVVVAEGGQVTMRRNTVSNNAVTGASGNRQGGGVYVAHAAVTATNNVIADNSAYLGGGFAAIANNTQLTASHNTIINNAAAHGIGGGALFVNNANNVQVTFRNNIVSGSQKYQIFEDFGAANQGQVIKSSIANNLFWNSQNGAYFNYVSNGLNDAAGVNAHSSVNGSSNIDGSPDFVDENTHNLILANTSAAIDQASTGQVEDKQRAMRDNQPDIGAYEYAATPVIKSPVYRFWSTKDRSHFYTIGIHEKNSILKSYLPWDWRYEYIAYDAFTGQEANTTQTYRFYSQAYGGHFYTISQSERDSLIANPTTSQWVQELPSGGFYVYPNDYTGASAVVYRFWSPTYRHHFYTNNTAERDHITATYPSNIWTYEGPRFRVPQ